MEPAESADARAPHDLQDGRDGVAENHVGTGPGIAAGGPEESETAGVDLPQRMP